MPLPVVVGQARSCEHPRAAKSALDVVGVQAHRQALSDELVRRAVLGAAHGEDRVLAHPCRQLLVLDGAPCSKRVQRGALDDQTHCDAGVEPRHDRGGHQRFVRSALVEAARAAQAQCLIECCLERIVALLRRTVLLRLARVAAARVHVAVLAQRGASTASDADTGLPIAPYR